VQGDQSLARAGKKVIKVPGDYSIAPNIQMMNR
jgi:hypothetical protein